MAYVPPAFVTCSMRSWGPEAGKWDEVTSIFGKHSLQLLAQCTRARQILGELSSGFLGLMFVQCTGYLESMTIVLW